MDRQNFINEQLNMLNDGFDKSQIKDNVYRYIFKNFILNFNINALIFECMELYSNIILIHLKTKKNEQI